MPASMITEHRVTHPEIDVDGDEATGIWYLQDKVIVPEYDFMLIGAGVLPRPLPANRRRLEDQLHRLRPHLRCLAVHQGLLDFKVKAGRAVAL